MTIAQGISPSDIPAADLKILQAALRRRIAIDSGMLLEVSVELLRREPCVDILSTAGGKISPLGSHVETPE